MYLSTLFQKSTANLFTSHNAKAFTTYSRKMFLFGLLIVMLIAARGSAQERPQVFALPDARAGEAYRANMEEVLREKYGLRLEAGSPRAIVLWSLADGEVPPGTSVRTDGTIVGTATNGATDNYAFRLKILDASAKTEELILNFSIAVKPGRLRLTKIEGPRLVAVDMRTSDTKSGRESSGIGNSAVNADQPLSGTNRADGLRSQAQADQRVAAARDALTQQQTEKANREKEEVKKAITNPISDLNKRFILGFEQTGAAASDSTDKPFFDIFINTPLSRKAPCADPDPSCLPRFSVWGDVRLTSTAEQVNALADVASDSVTAITGGKLNQIASAFDFTVGPEVRLGRFSNTHLSLIAGFGAVSPISPKQSAQIFQVPDQNSSQAAAFFLKYPGAKGKDQIAFISPDRDRFLRQYFGGFRFKTYNVDDKGQLQNNFPAMFDVTFGQNEAVTGGRFHKFVVGLDGFYPLPFPDKTRFLYF